MIFEDLSVYGAEGFLTFLDEAIKRGMMIMKIGFIGAGKVGSGFGCYLRARDMNVSGYFDLDENASTLAADAVEGRVFKSIDDVLKASDMVFITTQDDKIESVCNMLSQSSYFTSQHLIGHMSGASTCELLKSVSEKGAEVFVLHPLQAFTDMNRVAKQLETTYFSVETVAQLPVRVKELLDVLGNPYFELKPSQKAHYHMAAVIVSNYLTTLMDFGLTQMEQAGIPKEDAWKALEPLIKGALSNIDQLGPAGALTGPIARGDVSTVNTHLKALESDTEGRAFYQFMANRTLGLAQVEKIKDKDKIEAVKKALEN